MPQRRLSADEVSGGGASARAEADEAETQHLLRDIEVRRCYLPRMCVCAASVCCGGAGGGVCTLLPYDVTCVLRVSVVGGVGGGYACVCVEWWGVSSWVVQ